MNRVKQRIHYWCRDVIEENITGRGVRIAILDTGAVMHPDLRGRIYKFQDFVNHKKGLYDDSGHGTHVAGILAGNGRMSKGLYGGMAPESELLVVKVLDRKGDGSIEQILEGIQWIQRNRELYQIRIVNISVGAKMNLAQDKAKLLLDAVDHLWDCGITVVVSAGNYGPEEGTISIPGNSKKVITVGAMDEPMLKKNCSGIGPTEQCVVKPDLLAPGYQIISCSHSYPRDGKAYVSKSGTSMATPIVAGTAALFFSKYPDAGNVELKLKIYETCGRHLEDKVTGRGCVRVDYILKNN